MVDCSASYSCREFGSQPMIRCRAGPAPHHLLFRELVGGRHRAEGARFQERLDLDPATAGNAWLIATSALVLQVHEHFGHLHRIHADRHARMAADEIREDRRQQGGGEHRHARDGERFGGFVADHVGDLLQPLEPEKILLDRLA